MKFVYDAGLYEKGQYPSKVGGKRTKEYQIWSDMLRRCQPNSNFQLKQPTYIGCTVHPDFIKYQDFAEWCQTQIGFRNSRWALDKDILVPGNKVYGPDTCVFVSQALNNLLTHKQAAGEAYPTGVSYYRSYGNFVAQMKAGGKKKFIGYFETPELAEAAYKTAKINEVRRQAEIWKDQIDPRVYTALLNYKI